MQSFTEMVHDVFTKPPRDDGEPNGRYAHSYLGRHATFEGRRYRRGKTRCLHCGAPIMAADGPADEDRHLTAVERMKKNLTMRSALWERLKAKS